MCRSVIAACAVLLLLGSTPAAPVTLPDDTQQTEFLVMVCDQATITVPDEILFDVTDVTRDTVVTGLDIGASNLVLAQGSTLRIELKADAPQFLAPLEEITTWLASDVSWSAGTWTGGTGFAGTLENGVYHRMAESLGNPSALSSNNVEFTLKAKPGVTYAGIYDLTVTWRFGSLVP